MLYNLINKLDDKFHFSTVSAYCDMSCKIYDPIAAQFAILTIIHMVDLLEELKEKNSMSASNAKQYIDKKIVLDLLNKVTNFAVIFWQCKDVKTYTAVCPYPSEKAIVYPVLT